MALPRRHFLITGLSTALPTLALAEPGHRPGDALRPRPLVFPRDHGAHPETRTEWWYLTGHGQSAEGRVFGFQVTFFRSRVDVAQGLRSRLAARHLLFAHAAITDVQAGQLVHAERMLRWNGLPPASPDTPVFASEQDTHVALRDWFIRRGTGGDYEARIANDDLVIDLQARPTGPLLLQGQSGFSRKGPEAAQASFYVSEPQLDVQATLRVNGTAHTVRGRAWLDHEWSEAILHPEAVGWDWLGMNLHNGGALTAFRLRRRDGSAVWAGGSFRAAGQAQATAFDANEVRFEPLRHWTSPRTQARYPVAWRVATPAGTFGVQALVDSQELDSRSSTGTAYWEGVSDLLDAQGRPVGRGYLEMTGYAGRLSL